MIDSTLIDLRDLIDKLDGDLIAIIAKRHQISKQIGDYKRLHSMGVFDREREIKLQEYHNELSKKYNISKKFIEDIFQLIVSQSKLIQNR